MHVNMTKTWEHAHAEPTPISPAIPFPSPQGVLGLISYLGAANAGVPLALVVKHSGWDGYFTAMSAACVIALALLAPLANAKSFVQQAQAQKAKAP